MDLLSLQLVGVVGAWNYELILSVGAQHLESGSFDLEPSALYSH